jgi:hypothetical protein
MKVKILSSNNKSTWYNRYLNNQIIDVYYDIRLPKRCFTGKNGNHCLFNDDVVITELPESFCVKSCDDGIKWGKYIQWLNKNYNTDFCGRIFNSDRPYYGVINDEGCGIKIPFGTEIHIDDMINHIDYMESQQHINGGEQFSKESQLTVKMDKEFDLTTIEGRLAYARQHYPIGTKYIPLYSTGKSWGVHNIRSINYDIRLHPEGMLEGMLEGGEGYIYANGKWAEIIKGEEFDLTTLEGRIYHTKKHYPIGTKYIPLNSNGVPYKFIKEINMFPKYGSSCIEGGFGFIYANGKWAEIIKEEKNMETQKLSREGLKEIYSVACDEWQGKLKSFGYRNPLENYIDLTKEEVNEMFFASNDKQKSILSKYLKQDDGSINFDNLLGDGYKLNERQLIGKRVFGLFSYKSFYLDNKFDWKIQKDEFDELCLIPTRKK